MMRLQISTKPDESGNSGKETLSAQFRLFLVSDTAQFIGGAICGLLTLHAFGLLALYVYSGI